MLSGVASRAARSAADLDPTPTRSAMPTTTANGPARLPPGLPGHDPARHTFTSYAGGGLIPNRRARPPLAVAVAVAGVTCAGTSTRRCQIVVWPAEQFRAEHGGVEGEALRGIGGVVPGERLDPGQSIRDRAHGQVQATGGFGGDGAGGEVCVE